MMRTMRRLGFSQGLSVFAPEDTPAMEGGCGIEPPPGVPEGCPLFLMSDSSLRFYGEGKNSKPNALHTSLGQQPMFWGEDGSSVKGLAWAGGTTQQLTQHIVDSARSGVQNLHLFCFFNECIDNAGNFAGHRPEFE